MDHKVIEIYTMIGNQNIRVGTLFVNLVHQQENYSFQFDQGYLSNKYNEIIDPSIQISCERQFNSELFGFIQDAIPDRWGKNLIRRNEERIAKLEGRTPRTLFLSDYLLAVSDASRIGALRFKKANDKDFIQSRNNIPHYVFLNKLANLSYDINHLRDKELIDLLSPGSSLGGARPKASIYNQKQELYIAKFPSKNDDYDVELWEKITNDLAKLCKINVPDSQVVKSKYGHIFVAKRFDRVNKTRLPYVSMMSVLGAKDGNHDYSYLDLTDAIKTYSSSPKKDLLELFKRLAFNILIHNGDDHLRNHGFIKTNNKWVLSPAFDLNLSNEYHGLSLSIDGFTRGFETSNLVEVSKYFSLSEKDARQIVSEMKSTIKKHFLLLANKYHAKKSEIDSFKTLFN